MESAFCSICKTIKPLNDCWCVIDAKTKERYYECKKKCQNPQPSNIPQSSNTIQKKNEKETEIRTPSNTEEIDDEPPQGLLERARKWFSNGYTKIKME